jgi:hypothetical protein
MHGFRAKGVGPIEPTPRTYPTKDMNKPKKEGILMEYTLLKLAALIILFTVVLPIVRVFIQEKVKQEAKEKPRHQDMSFNELRQLKEIYDRERKPYYLEAQSIFNSLCKKGKMHSGELLLLKTLLEESLGSYVNEYRGWKFKNEFNRIYCYLKSWHITQEEWEEIIKFLNELQEKAS